MNDDGNFAEMDDYVVKDLEDVRKVDKIRVQHATVAKKVDVKRLKKDLWTELEAKTALTPPINIENIDGCGDRDDICAGDVDEKNDEVSIKENISDKEISFKNVVENIGVNEKQEDVSLAFYFICVLHLANEKCLKLENGEHGLNDFIISRESE
jgi:condensin complex subunit 2